MITQTPRRRLAAGTLAAALTAGGLIAAPAAVASAAPAAMTSASASTNDVSSVRSTVLTDTNEVRAEVGRAPLDGNGAMNDVAQRWAEYMAESGQFRHSDDYYLRIPSGWTRAAENIAYGQSPAAVVEAWDNSPGHRANMIGDFTDIGIGYAVDDDGRPYYVQVFARY